MLGLVYILSARKPVGRILESYTVREQGTHIVLAVGQTSDSEIRPTPDETPVVPLLFCKVIF